MCVRHQYIPAGDRQHTVLLHVDTVMYVCVSDISIDLPVSITTLYFCMLTL